DHQRYLPACERGHVDGVVADADPRQHLDARRSRKLRLLEGRDTQRRAARVLEQRTEGVGADRVREPHGLDVVAVLQEIPADAPHGIWQQNFLAISGHAWSLIAGGGSARPRKSQALAGRVNANRRRAAPLKSLSKGRPNRLASQPFGPNGALQWLCEASTRWERFGKRWGRTPTRSRRSNCPVPSRCCRPLSRSAPPHRPASQHRRSPPRSSGGSAQTSASESASACAMPRSNSAASDISASTASRHRIFGTRSREPTVAATAAGCGCTPIFRITA